MSVARAKGVKSGWSVVACAGWAALAGGCASGPDLPVLMDRGEFGVVREALAGSLTEDRSDRSYILDRMGLTIASLADGYPRQARVASGEMYDLLSTAGINEDRTVASVVLVEGVKIWKGEPFEQAMAYAYVSMARASEGQWDNAGVAARESLFRLKTFGDRVSTSADLVREAQRRDGESSAYLDSGYQPVETDFVPGYVLAGLSALALGSTAEATDQFSKAVRFNAGMKPVTDRLLGGSFNTVLVVEAGVGPEKVRYGPDGALTRFVPRRGSLSDQAGLVAEVDGVTLEPVPVAADMNELAAKHFWNNLEDVRRAKSLIGNVLVAGGAIVAMSSDDRRAQTAGLAVALGGLLLKATSGADTRHCEFLPQRVYFVPMTIEKADTTVRLSVSGRSWSIVLPGVDPPAEGERFQLRYVRIPAAPVDWARAGATAVLYANDGYAGRVAGDELPYILGGTCVRMPTLEVLERYQAAGRLRDLTLADLRNLYAAEGIILDPNDPRLVGERHVLEGGRSLVAPQAGTAGYTRVFCRGHLPYAARSKEVRERQAAEKAKGAGGG